MWRYEAEAVELCEDMNMKLGARNRKKAKKQHPQKHLCI
jgi:hypothetical protein